MSTFFSAGCNYHQRLSRDGPETLTELPLPDDITYLAAGWFHNIFYSPSEGWFGGGAIIPEGGGPMQKLPQLEELVPICVACGDNKSVVVTENNELYFFSGSVNPTPRRICPEKKWIFVSLRLKQIIALAENELGLFYWSSSDSSTPIHALKQYQIIDAAAGDASCLALTADGEVYGWGEGAAAGIGSSDSDVNSPKKVRISCQVSRVSCGSYNSYIIDSDGNLWSSGRSADSQSGQTSTNEFKQLPKFSKSPIISVCGGHYIAYALNEDGDVFGAGKGEFHAMMMNDESNHRSFVQANNVQGRHFSCLCCGCYHVIVGENAENANVHPIFGRALKIVRKRKFVLRE